MIYVALVYLKYVNNAIFESIYSLGLFMSVAAPARAPLVHDAARVYSSLPLPLSRCEGLIFFPQFLNKSLSLLVECVSVLRQLSETADQTRTVRPAPRALCVLFAISAVHAIIKREHHHAECCMAQWVRTCACVYVCVCVFVFIRLC